MRARLVIATVCLAAWSGAFARALADDTPSTDAPVTYEDTIRRALQEFDLDHWYEAKVLFERAHALRPNARTLRGLGLACYEAQQYVEAIGYFEQALVHEVQPLTPEMRDDVTRYLRQARQFVSRVELQIQPASAQLAIDARAAAPLPPDGVVLLDPGPHDMRFAADGCETELRRVLADGHVIQLQVTLKSTAITLTPQPPVPAPPVSPIGITSQAHDPPRDANHLGPWLVVGLSAAVTVAGGTLFAVALANKARVAHPDTPARWSDYAGTYETGKVLFPLGATLFGVGLAGLATGLTLRFLPDSKPSAEGAAVVVGPGSVHLTGHL